MDRAWLAGTLWPDSTDGQALGNLRRSLCDLRGVLGPEGHRLCAPTPGTVALDMCGAFLDVAEFDRDVKDGGPDALAWAVALYTGPLLEGCYEEWALPERVAREQDCLAALERLAAHRITKNEHAQAALLLRRAVALDPLRESALRALMGVLAAQGDTAAAVQAYREARRSLRQEFSTEPSAETTDLFRRLQAETGRAETKAAAPAASPPPAAPRLPRSLTPLVGREAEIAAVLAHLDGARLVTLTGPGGIGKTRLALAAAERLADEYADGPRFVDLAPLDAPALVTLAVAAAVDVREEMAAPLIETLTAALRDRRLLLVLDNCEHLIDACARLAETLLKSCPSLTVLATSREFLNIPGEHVHPVPPLSLPSDSASLVPDALGHESVRLFAERAAAQGAGWALHAGNVADVAQICRRLDGIPLAIELAASRVRTLSTDRIAAHLDDRFRLLTGGPRTALPRQQTLKAAIDWGHDLLTEEERTLLRRLSVFPGGWTLEDAEAVCADSETQSQSPLCLTERGRVLDLLSSLEAKSFVVYAVGEGRSRMLETVRQYGLEKLDEHGETEAMRGRHLDAFARLAIDFETQQRGPRAAWWLARLDAELDNLRSALAWGLQQAPDDDARALQVARMTHDLWGYWTTRLMFPEEYRYAVAVLAASPAVRHGDEGKRWFVGLALEHNAGGDFAASCGMFEEFEDWCRAHGDDSRLLLGLHNHAITRIEMGDWPGAKALAERFHAEIARVRAAGVLPESGLDGWRDAADGTLAAVAFETGDYATAHALELRGVAALRAQGASRWLSLALLGLGRVLLKPWAGQDLDGAAAHFRESLELSLRADSTLGVWGGVLYFALLAAARQEWASAARLGGAAAGTVRSLGATINVENRQKLDALPPLLRPEMGEAAFEAAWAEGEAMTLPQAAALALEEVTNGVG